MNRIGVYLSVYVCKSTSAKMARGQHAGLVLSRGVLSLSGRRPVGPTYEIYRGPKHVFKQYRTSGIHWC